MDCKSQIIAAALMHQRYAFNEIFCTEMISENKCEDALMINEIEEVFFHKIID